MTLFKENKIILDLCGGTGSWSNPYKENGYDVRIIDIKEDVRLFKKPNETIYGILSAPPCQHLASSGSRWWAKKGEKPLLEALSVADACIRIVYATNPVFWALENPRGRLSQYLGKPIKTFQPYEYGHYYSKRTCLWGNFNMPSPTKIVKPKMVNYKTKKGKIKRMSEKHYKLTNNSKRGIERSVTPKGFAEAFYECNK
tara:strand:- start:17551 stop:18147 length:597 start_codon:yes stop_codon:yes gene_type:complete